MSINLVKVQSAKEMYDACHRYFEGHGCCNLQLQPWLIINQKMLHYKK